MTKRTEYTPDVALEKLIELERHREQCNTTEECVICGKPANGRQYPAPFPTAADANPALRSLHPSVWYRACGRDHADRFYGQCVDLHNDILRPWRAIANALARGEQVNVVW